MLEDINKAYNEHVNKYNSKPEYISMHRELFDEISKQDPINDQPFIMGMHPLIVSDESSSFNLHKKVDLDKAFKEFIYKDSREMKTYVVTNFTRDNIIEGDINPNSNLSQQSVFEEVHISYKVMRAYERHLEMKKNGETR